MIRTREDVLEQFRDLLFEVKSKLQSCSNRAELSDYLSEQLEDIPDPDDFPSRTIPTKIQKRLQRLRKIALNRGEHIRELESLLDQQETQFYRMQEERNELRDEMTRADTVRIMNRAFRKSKDMSDLKDLIMRVRCYLMAESVRNAQGMMQSAQSLGRWFEGKTDLLYRMHQLT